MKLSIVATLYQSEPTLHEFYRRATQVAQQFAGTDYEIVLVNDGSPDNSLALGHALQRNDPRLVLVDLSRNFGHHKAIMTGLSYAKGELVFLLDSDLEEEPEWLVPFVKQLQEEQCDVVYGQQACRKGDRYERVTGGWFYTFFRLISGIKLPENTTTARVMTRRYVDALMRFDEREMFLGGLWHLTGFAQHPQLVTKHSTSPTSYNFRRKMAIVLNSVTSFSNAPLVMIFYVGAAISSVAGAYSLYLVGSWLFFDAPTSGWTSVMVSIWLLGGLIICFLGVIGLYIAKIFSETKRRPYTIVRQVYDQTQP